MLKGPTWGSAFEAITLTTQSDRHGGKTNDIILVARCSHEVFTYGFRTIAAKSLACDVTRP